MTTNVTISTNYVMSPRKLRVRSVNPADENQIWRELIVEPASIEAQVPNEQGVKTMVLETLYVHDGAKLIIEEID